MISPGNGRLVEKEHAPSPLARGKGLPPVLGGKLTCLDTACYGHHSRTPDPIVILAIFRASRLGLTMKLNSEAHCKQREPPHVLLVKPLMGTPIRRSWKEGLLSL